jgi:hypothetical protein
LGNKKKMSQFDYTLPSGARFRVQGPAGATQTEADTVFYEQVAAGSLVGYESGQTLTSLATRITKFELSRLDRGTAGVDTVAVLSIVQNLPVVSGIPDLVNTPVQSPVNQTDIVLARGDGLGPSAVGPLTAFQVQTLQAQLINLVDQPFNVISQEKGIGKYGLTCLQLEQAGYVKPGTFARFLANNPENFVAVMNSPSIWTGLGGINGLDDLLADNNIQDVVQNRLMQMAYTALTATGVISNVPQPGVTLSQGQIFTPRGLQTLNALNLLGGNAGISAGLLSRPVDNLSTISSGAIGNVALAQTAINIGNRITGEIGALVGNASQFGPIATTAWANSGGLPSVSSLLTGAGGLPTLASVNINKIASSLTNINPANLSNLKQTMDNFGKSLQFSLNFTNPLSSLSNVNVQGLANRALTNVQGLAGNALSNAQTLAGNALTNAQTLAGNALTNAQNLAGNALTNAQNLAGGALTNIQGQLTGSIGQLTSLFSGSGDLVSGTQVAAGFNNTVNRKTVDAAVTRILGNNKIPTPSFEYPSLASVAEKLDIRQAQNVLNGLRGQGQALINQGQGIFNRATSSVGQVQSTINRLI